MIGQPTSIEYVACALHANLSVTSTMKLKKPGAAVVVPLISAEVEFSERPGGSAPATMLQLYGAVPPLAESVAPPKGTYCVATGKGDGGAMLIAGHWGESVITCDPGQPLLSTALTVKA